MKELPIARIALVDDHVLFRKGMAALIEDDERAELVFEASDGNELLEKLKTDQPDIVILDLEMKGMDGLEATRQVKKLYPHIKIIILTMHESDALISKLMEAGAGAYLLKSSDMGEAEKCVDSVYDTGYYFNERISKAMLGALVNKNQVKPTFNELDPLTEREIDVLKLVCEEHSSEEIADRIHLSPRTVEGYRRRLLEKTGAKNLAGLVIYAIQHGYFSVPEKKA